MAYVKDSLSFITGLDIDIVEFPVYIKLGEVLSILKFYNKLRD